MTGANALELIFAVAVVAMGFAATIWVLRRGVVLLAPRPRARLLRLLPLFEVGLGAAAILVIGALLLEVQPTGLAVAFVAVLVLLLGAGWFAVRDLVSGAVLRAEEAYDPGQWIRIDGVDGRIRSVGLRTLEVEREDGTRVRIPYTRLATSPLVRAGRAEDPSGHSFAVDLPPELGPVRMLPIIRSAARNCFFVSATRDPQVRVTSGSEGHRYEVTVFTMDRTFVPEVEAAVRRRIDQEL